MLLPDVVSQLKARLEPLPESHPIVNATDGTLASVIALLFLGDEGEMRIWLAMKSPTLRKHGGQVALPGGKVDPGDVSLLATALREANEEIGILPSQIEVLGALPSFATTTGFHVVPFVGFLANPVELTPDLSEITRVFHAPLAMFAIRGELREVKVQSWQWKVPSYVVDGDIVWGATAAILHELASRLVREGPSAGSAGSAGSADPASEREINVTGSAR